MEHGAEMTSMKMSPKESKAMMEPQPVQEEYPYGLRVTLNQDDMKKLGMEMPKMGEMMMLHAKAKVTDTHESGDNASCSMQITDMAMEPEKTKKEASEKLYGEGHEKA